MKGMFQSMLMGSKVCNNLFPRILQFEVIPIEMRGHVDTDSARGAIHHDRLGALGVRKQRDLA